MKQSLDKTLPALLGVFQSFGLKSRLPCVSALCAYFLAANGKKFNSEPNFPHSSWLQRAAPMLQAEVEQGWGLP